MTIQPRKPRYTVEEVFAKRDGKFIGFGVIDNQDKKVVLVHALDDYIFGRLALDAAKTDAASMNSPERQ